jgi:hypothetical protein
MLIKANKDRIQLNPFILSGVLYPLIDLGNDETGEDRSATSDPKNYTNPVRISTRKRWMLNKNEKDTPVNTQLFDWYMISDNETLIDEQLEFTYQDMDFKVTNIREINKYGELIGYEYELTDITEGEVA